ncbi:MAG TPA: acyltransferase family protein [Mycobacteriales bacterium]|nr:acyltransferase family protein [Mycobacteriales bacterium]
MPPAPTGRSRLPYRADVEGFRAVAVGLVVLYHAGFGFPGGFVGVDVFFVLSGFLITGLLTSELHDTGGVSFLRFYGRRCRRLLPLATLVLAVTAIAFAAILSPIDRAGLAHDIRAAALYYANWHFAAGSLNYAAQTSTNPVLHYWSLSVEEQFYLVWPALLFLVTRRMVGRRTRWSATQRMATALAVLALGSLVLSVIVTDVSEPYAYYGLHTRAWELAAGGLLALGAHRLGRLPPTARVVAGWAGLALVVGSGLLMNGQTPFPGIAALAPVGGTVLLVAAGTGADRLTGAGRLLANRPMRYVGRISYGWYLWHWPCLMFVGTLTMQPSSAVEASTFQLARGWWALLAVAVSFGLSVLTHHLFEDRVRRSAWLAAARRRSLAMGAAASAAAIGVAVTALPASSGAVDQPVLAYVAAVRHLGPHAAHAGTVPADVRLSMAPAQARGDTPSGTRDCYSDYPATAAPADCEFGDPHGRVTIALIGDSHAQQWFPAFERAAVKRHWRLWLFSKPACVMIDLPERLPQFNDTYPWCTSWRRAVLARLASLPRLDAVVVTHYAGLSLDAGRYAAADGSALSASELPAAWQQAWHRTDRALQRIARRVIVLRDTPKPATDVPACLAAHGTDDRSCSFPRRGAFQTANQILRAERAGAGARTRFASADDVLCPGDPCPVVSPDGTIIYRDDHHLTAAVSADLTGVIERRIARLLPPTGKAAAAGGG